MFITAVSANLSLPMMRRFGIYKKIAALITLLAITFNPTIVIANEVKQSQWKSKITALVTLLAMTAILIFPKTISAQVDIDLGVPDGDPIFVVENMLPGDTEQRSITVTNNTSSSEILYVRCEEIEEIKEFSEILDMVIRRDGVDIYGGTTGAKTVEEFCEAAAVQFNLGTILPDTVVNYSFIVTFPPEAGNEYQLAKYVFDLLFQTKGSDSLVINEVYYLVDSEHGLDSKKDRDQVHGVIEGNAAGTRNIIDLRIRNTCIILQSNTANVNTSINTGANSGGNLGSLVYVGSASSSVSVFNLLNFNFAQGNCGGMKTGINDEWIELYNPTDSPVPLKNWSVKDASGSIDVINPNLIIDPKGFVLIAHSSDTWRFWNEPIGTKKINFGSDIGDGLDNTGDHLYLINPAGDEVDFTSWGDDTEIWNPAVSLVSLGSSMERLTPGLDNDLTSDWEVQKPPSPGL